MKRTDGRRRGAATNWARTAREREAMIARLRRGLYDDVIPLSPGWTREHCDIILDAAVEATSNIVDPEVWAKTVQFVILETLKGKVDPGEHEEAERMLAEAKLLTPDDMVGLDVR